MGRPGWSGVLARASGEGDGAIKIVTNWPQTCNAVYGANTIFMDQSNAGMCSNAGENQGIVVHEWGHGYDHNDGGDADNTSEAYGDVVSIFATRSSCFATGLRVDGTLCTGYGDACLTCTGFRDFDYVSPVACRGIPRTRAPRVARRWHNRRSR